MSAMIPPPPELQEITRAISRRAESLCEAAKPHCDDVPCVRHTAEAVRQLRLL